MVPKNFGRGREHFELDHIEDQYTIPMTTGLEDFLSGTTFTTMKTMDGDVTNSQVMVSVIIVMGLLMALLLVTLRK